MIDVSVIIVSFNTRKLTLQCIKSVALFKGKLNVEIIVVDNGSTDDSVKEIENLKFRNGNLQLKIITNKENLGYAKANNQALKVARGEYILLLNSDTKVNKDAIEKLIVFVKEKSDVGVIGSRLLNIDGTIQPSVFRFPTIRRAIRQYWLGKKAILDKYAPSGEKPVCVEAVVGAAFLITPHALKRVGLLDERYFMFYEDLDYCRRVWRKGLKVYYLPSSQIFHYHGASGRGIKDTKNQWRRLIPSSKIYHGILGHYLINFIIWSGQKWQRN